MRPTFMGFETAKGAIFTNQKSLDIVGNNLANIDTNGYTRQRVDRDAMAVSFKSSRVASPGARIGLTGQGVEALGVSQSRDAFLDKRFRDEYTKTSYHGQAANILSDIQSAIGDANDITSLSDFTSALEQIYDSLDNFASESNSQTLANLVMSAFQNMNQVLNQTYAKLENVAQQQIGDLEVTTDRVNDVLQQIAHLNQMISEDATVLADPDNEYFRPNELLDQRNLLLDELAGYGDISVTERSDGSVDVSMGGHSVVSGKEYSGMTLQKNDDSTVSVMWSSTGEPVTLSNGSIRASLDFINGRGKNVQSKNETPEQGILYYKDRLDTFAAALADIANHSIPTEVDENGQPVKDANGQVQYKVLIAAKTDTGKTDSKAPVSAGNISISDEWTQGGPGYFVISQDQFVPQYAQKLSQALVGDSYTFTSYGEKFTGTFEDFLTDTVGKLGSDLSFQNGRSEATALVADDFLDRRDEISGVSRDEETADMLKYQKSYEAAARLMTVLDEALDVLINRMGRVGL